MIALSKGSRRSIPSKRTGGLRFLAGFAASALACATSTPIQERAWIEVSTPNFQIMSTKAQEDISELAIDLERFRTVVTTLTNAPASDSPVPTRIVVFERPSDFHQFVSSRGVGGIFSQGMRSNVVALSYGKGMDPAAIIRHEYVHFVLHNGNSIQYPPWYDEGFAEYLRSVAVHEDKFLVVGAVPKDRVDELRWVTWMPLKRIISSRSPGDLPDAQAALFYAQAWGLVHYLNQGRDGAHDVSEELDHYLELVEAGASDADAFRQAFGISISAADSALKIYLTRKLEAMAFPLSVLNFHPPDPSVRSLSPDEVSTKLGQIGLMSEVYTRAQSFFEAALAANPSNARAEAGLGDALKLQDLWQDAEPHFERAIKLDPSDPLNYLDLAEYLQSKADRDEFAKDRAELLREARRQYVKSQKLDSTLPETYAMYGSTYLEPGENPARGVEPLEHAHRLFPGNVDILLILAKAYALTDRDDEAHEIVERFRAWTHSKDREEEVAEILRELQEDATDEPDTSAAP